MCEALEVGTLGSYYIGTDSSCKHCQNEPMVLAQDSNKEFARRLRQAIVAAGWKDYGAQTQLAKIAGTSPKAANKWMNGEAIPRRSRLQLIAQALDVSQTWLEYGEGDSLYSVGERPVGEHSVRESGGTYEANQNAVLIRQYDTGGRGGPGIVLRDQPGVIETWTVDKDWLRANLPHYTNANALAIVTGFGDSMPQVYSPGDPVLVDTGVTTCDHDGIYFFRIGEEGFIKRLQRIPGKGIRVLSQNPEYEAWTITPEMDFAVMGKVLRAWMGKNY